MGGLIKTFQVSRVDSNQTTSGTVYVGDEEE